MDLMQAMRERHSVRVYTDRPIDPDAKAALEASIARVNGESGLSIQLVCDEPRAFEGGMAHYGGFSGVRNYIALVGEKAPDLEERCGYWGEHLVLEARAMGLDTCWVGLTYRKVPSALSIGPGQRLALVICVGYGKTHGTPHKVKAPGQVSTVATADGTAPDWFARGVEAALLAPTAVNQQKFHLTLTDGGVAAKRGVGFYTACDLGIVKYHFELGAAPHEVRWL